MPVINIAVGLQRDEKDLRILSKVTPVTPNGNSFKTVIPQPVAHVLELDKDEYLEWKRETIDGRESYRVWKSKK